jgi:hypothetical protein
LELLLGARHGVKPTHTLEEIEKLHSLLPKQCRLLAAYDGDKLIGGIVLVTLHDRAMYSLYMAQEYEYQKHHPISSVMLGNKYDKTDLNIALKSPLPVQPYDGFSILRDRRNNTATFIILMP